MNSVVLSEKPKIPSGFPKNINEWTEEYVATFLAENGVRNNGYMDVIKKEAIDGEALLYLNAGDYERWSIPGAQANKIVRLVNNLKKGDGLPEPARSQLWISSTRLKEKQGPEIHVDKRKKAQIRHKILHLGKVKRNYYTELLQAIKDAQPNDLDDYSNPAKMIRLPFPYRGSRYPYERFHFTPLNFTSPEFNYMGRREFKLLSDEVSQLAQTPFSTQCRELYLYGTIGYGKSYLLAAMVCSLIQKGKNVVYLPDCRALLDKPVRYIQDALLLTFADRDDYQEEIAHCKSFEALGDLIERLGNEGIYLYFVIDQYNVLDSGDGECDNMKERVKSELGVLMYRHCVIRSASADHQQAIRFEQKQTNNIKHGVYGGLTEEEMGCWYEHYKNVLPEFSPEDKAKIEDLTGRIPLLLYGLIRGDFHGKPYHDVDEVFFSTEDIMNVVDWAVLFTEQMNQKGGQYWQRYCDLIMACCTGKSVLPGYTREYDRRFFYIDNDGIGHSTCGLARDAVLMALRKLEYDPFLDSAVSFRIAKNNTSVLDFLIKQKCLSSISRKGLKVPYFSFDSMPIKIWRGKYPDFDMNEYLALYVPLAFNYQAIDGIIVHLDKNELHALLIPIQITTTTKCHPDSKHVIFALWKSLKPMLEGYTLGVRFLWFREQQMFTTTHSMESDTLKYKKHKYSISKLDPDIGYELESLRKGQSDGGSAQQGSV